MGKLAPRPDRVEPPRRQVARGVAKRAEHPRADGARVEPEHVAHGDEVEGPRVRVAFQPRPRRAVELERVGIPVRPIPAHVKNREGQHRHA